MFSPMITPPLMTKSTFCPFAPRHIPAQPARALAPYSLFYEHVLSLAPEYYSGTVPKDCSFFHYAGIIPAQSVRAAQPFGCLLYFVPHFAYGLLTLSLPPL